MRGLLLAALVAALVASTGLVGAPPASADDGIERETLTFEQVAAIDELTAPHADVLRLYWAFFDRPPDAGGALYWLEQFEQCVRIDDIVESFSLSAEFGATYGPVDDLAFMDLIYRNVLDRAPDTDGLGYWLGLLTTGRIDRADAMLHFSLSPEFARAHPLPSDGVPGRGCRLGGRGPSSARAVTVRPPIPFASVGDVVLTAPSMAIERIGFHQSTNDGALPQSPLDAGWPVSTLASRNRDTDRRGAADVVVHPMLDITSPVTGTVLRSGGYTLYCRHRDDFVVVEPDARPGWEVKVLHLDGVTVGRGDRVEAGRTVIAPRAHLLPFGSQIDDLTANPSWPHVHIEVIDPSIPDRITPGSGC